MDIPRTSLFVLGWAATVAAAFAFGAVIAPQRFVSPSSPPATPSAAPPDTAVTLDELKNSYVYLFDQIVRLQNGVYYTGVTCSKEWDETKDYQTIDREDWCFKSQDPLDYFNALYDDNDIWLDEKMIAYGDVNGDGLPDALAQLAQRGGGTGTFYFVQLFLNQNGKPAPVAIVSLGDRQGAASLRLGAGEITIEHLFHLPDDPACCPSSSATKKFQWVNNTLKPVL